MMQKEREKEETIPGKTSPGRCGGQQGPARSPSNQGALEGTVALPGPELSLAPAPGVCGAAGHLQTPALGVCGAAGHLQTPALGVSEGSRTLADPSPGGLWRQQDTCRPQPRGSVGQQDTCRPQPRGSVGQQDTCRPQPRGSVEAAGHLQTPAPGVCGAAGHLQTPAPGVCGAAGHLQTTAPGVLTGGRRQAALLAHAHGQARAAAASRRSHAGWQPALRALRRGGAGARAGGGAHAQSGALCAGGGRTALGCAGPRSLCHNPLWTALVLSDSLPRPSVFSMSLFLSAPLRTFLLASQGLSSASLVPHSHLLTL
ncbi:collagen alpha-1(I) chain-like [Falco cherrug]|uniref:collagen alpha-1(I) chain-like n=1 Tax=Falco cherrug TaxID=345164 RepID=UPI002479EF37|nr:collagen alpha-1(I) chain-like [Falco cherrug]XP_055566049.1 collagen alpha-1(I) chain-like [Falco cherrug]XP_055566050.1 collagen alpha-1(I) chain-like [Falco cherrug]XP_055566051.1 collagen alpha-1(I) chain-like [Falco cherrug]XP_055566052.1 collagen alpha-1(I) chain-like [Falco cherrug]